MATTELQTFLDMWDAEAQKTVTMLRALPIGQYDFRPDAGARSLGELAWHLAEADAYVSWGIEQGKFTPGAKAPGLERPRSIEALAPGYERVHAEAVARVQRLGADDLDRRLTYFDGKRSEEHTSELQSLAYLVCRLLLEKKKKITDIRISID